MGGTETENKIDTSGPEQRLYEILERIEEQYPFDRSNDNSINKLVFIWIIGKTYREVEAVQKLLENERKHIIQDERILQIFSVRNPFDWDQVNFSIIRGIESASKDYLGVDLFHISFCPLFLEGTLEEKKYADRLAEVCARVIASNMSRNRTLEWHPYTFIRNEKVEMTQKQLTHMKERVMKRMIVLGRQIHINICSPCCVISDINENGYEISLAQRAKSLLMLTVFRNTPCENRDLMDNTIFEMLDEDEENCFFTARAISICEPIKTISLNRFMALHDKLQGGFIDQAGVYEKWNHQYFAEDDWNARLDHLPRDNDGKVMTHPIYSCIPMKDRDLYTQELMRFGNAYYLEHFTKDLENIEVAYWKSFWNEYFISRVGSLKNLDRLEENRSKIQNTAPQMRVHTLVEDYGAFQDYRAEYESYLAQTLQGLPSELVELVLNQNSKYMDLFREKKKRMADIVIAARNAMDNVRKRMGQTEMVLTHAYTMSDAGKWLEEAWINDSGLHSRRMLKIYEHYQKTLCTFFQKEKPATEEEIYEMITFLYEVYNEAVADSLESREEYMRRLLNSVSGNLEGFVDRLEKNWLFPVHIVGMHGHADENIFIMGSRNNSIGKRMRERYKVAFKERNMDDRLEIVRVSGRFGINNV